MKEKCDQYWYEEGAQHSIKNRQDNCFFVRIFQKYRKSGIFTGGRGRCDAGTVIELCCDYGDQEKRKKFSHKIAHKSNASKLCSSQTTDGDTCQAVPAHAACNCSSLVHRKLQDTALACSKHLRIV